MKHPRKALSVAGVGMAIGLMALAGCSSGPAASDQSTASKGSDAAVSLIRPGTLTVCTHLPYAPFQFNDDSGKTIGFDVDMMDLVAKKLGVEQAIVDTPFEGIKSGQDMSTGKCDIAAAGMTITDERQKVILFSEPYFDATQALLVAERLSRSRPWPTSRARSSAPSPATTGLDYAKKNAERTATRSSSSRTSPPEPQAAAHRPGRRRDQRPPGLDRGDQEEPGRGRRSPPSSTPVSSTASG